MWTNIIGIITNTNIVTLVVGIILGLYIKYSVKNVAKLPFDKALSKYKSELSEGIEELKGTIQKGVESYKILTGSTLDRETRFNEKEYAGIVECWVSFSEVLNLALEQHLQNKPTLLNMYTNQAKEFELERLKISKDKIEKILLITDANKQEIFFQSVFKEMYIAKITERYECFKKALYTYQIFFDDALYNEFNDLLGDLKNYIDAVKVIDRRDLFDTDLYQIYLKVYFDFKKEIEKKSKKVLESCRKKLKSKIDITSLN